MIKFSGKIENEIQAKILTKRGQFAAILILICVAVSLLICLTVWLINRTVDGQSIQIMACIGICVVVGAILFIPARKNKLSFEWDFDIKFEDGIITVIFVHQYNAVQTYKLSKVKKVIDYGKYYYLYLNRVDPSNGIVCQKDLLTEGTVEQFEKLFEGKIKRKVI